MRRLPGAGPDNVYTLLQDYPTYALLRKECKRKDECLLEYGTSNKGTAHLIKDETGPRASQGELSVGEPKVKKKLATIQRWSPRFGKLCSR